MSELMVARVRDRSKARGMAKFLFQTLASHHNLKTGRCDPSLERLAWEITKSQPYVRKLLKVIEAIHELRVYRGRGRGHVNHYEFLLSGDEAEKGTPEYPFIEEKGTPHPEKGTGRSVKGHSYVSPKGNEREEERVLPMAHAPEMKIRRCSWDGCQTPACPHAQACAYHACCEVCAREPSP